MPEYQGPGQIVEAQASARLDDSAAGIALKGSAERAAQAANNGPWKDLLAASKAVQGLALTVSHTYDEYSKFRAQEAANAYEEEMMKHRAELESLQGSNALGPEGVSYKMQQFQKEARERWGKRLNGRSRMFFNNAADTTDSKSYVWTLQKEGREMQAYQRTVDLGTITTAYNQAMNDDSQLGQSMGTIKATLEQMGRREGWSPEFTKAKIQEEEQKLIGGAVQSKLDVEDYAGASRIFNALGSKLSPAQRMKIVKAQGEMILHQAKKKAALGDYAGARQLINDFAVHGSTAGSYSSSGKSIAEDFNNPLNEKRAGSDTGTRADFKQFSTLAEGVRSNGGLLQRYTTKYGCKTLKDVIYRWAPPKVKGKFENNTVAYLAGVAKRTGIDPDKPIDFSNKETLAKVIQAMAVQESPLGNKLTVADIKGMLEGGDGPEWAQSMGKTGTTASDTSAPISVSKNTVSLGSPSLDAQATKFLSGLAKEERAAIINTVSKKLFDETKDMEGEYRAGYAMSQLMENEEYKDIDEDTRQGIIKEIKQMDEAEKYEWKARDYKAAHDAVEKAKDEGWAPSQFNDYLKDAEGMTPEAKELARKEFGSDTATKETLENSDKTRELFTLIDKKRNMSDKEIAAYATDNHLTIGQYNEAIKYRDEGGNVGHLSQSDINTAYKQMYPGKENKEVPSYLWTAIAKELKPGEPVTVEKIKPIIAKMLIEGEAGKASIIGTRMSDMTYGESITNPDVRPNTFKATSLTSKQRLAIINTIKSSNERDILNEYLANPSKYPAEG